LVLTLCTLLLSYSNFSSKIFKGYFECSLIFWVNFAIPTAICLLLFAVIGRAWIAFLLTAVICLGISIGNYYLIIIRNDPLQFEDLTCIREALAITDKQGYELNLSRNLIISILVGVFYPAIGSANIGTFQLMFFVPAMLISIILLKLKIKETKDIDLTTIE
jgi:hypothetical protein